MSLTPDIEPIADVVIGSRVAHIMWLEDVTQTDMAKAMRMDQATLSRKLRGERKWSAAEIVRASKVLRIRIGWIFGEVLEARDPEDEDNGIIDDAARPKGFEPLTFWSGVWEHERVTRCRAPRGYIGPDAGVEIPPLLAPLPAPRSAPEQCPRCRVHVAEERFGGLCVHCWAEQGEGLVLAA